MADLVTLAVAAVLGLGALPSPALASVELKARGRFFSSADGRTVLLRGVNVSAAGKLAPFDPLPGGKGDDDLRLLSPLKTWGFNAIRLLFTWEGYEPSAGHYNEAYLERYARLAETAWSLGIYTILDMHQDSFSRYLDDGCGIGFPAWVSGSSPTPPPVKNCGPLWAVHTAMSSAMHRAYTGFYANRFGARDHFLEVWRRIAHRMRDVPGVIGYDLLNEPWANEQTQLGPLQTDIVAAIRSEDPTGIAFVEPGLLAVLGLVGGTNMDRPTFDNFAYAPHYYDIFAAGIQVYIPLNPITDAVFERLPRQARDWGVPLHLGEFGGYGQTKNLAELMAHQYDLLDDSLASGTQWNYTPTWTPESKDGWNGEDYSIVDDHGNPRGNFSLHPYPRFVSGVPTKFSVGRDRALNVTSVELRWTNFPEAGAGVTEIFLPWDALFAHHKPVIETEGVELSCGFSVDGQTLICRSQARARLRVRVSIAAPRSGA